MFSLMFAWEIASYYKFGNDLALIQRGLKNPMEVFIETSLNDYAKKIAYNSLNYNN